MPLTAEQENLAGNPTAPYFEYNGADPYDYKWKLLKSRKNAPTYPEEPEGEVNSSSELSVTEIVEKYQRRLSAWIFSLLVTGSPTDSITIDRVEILRNLEASHHVSEDQLKRQRAIQLLEKWCHEDIQEQKETWEYLKKALDDDRLSYRKLFPKK